MYQLTYKLYCLLVPVNFCCFQELYPGSRSFLSFHFWLPFSSRLSLCHLLPFYPTLLSVLSQRIRATSDLLLHFGREWMPLVTMAHFIFWISLLLRPKTRDQTAQLCSRSDVEFNQSQPRVIADVIGDSSRISPYFFVYFWISDKAKWFSLIKT